MFVIYKLYIFILLNNLLILKFNFFYFRFIFIIVIKIILNNKIFLSVYVFIKK